MENGSFFLGPLRVADMRRKEKISYCVKALYICLNVCVCVVYMSAASRYLCVERVVINGG